ncbi:ABC transporter substrate-binding protein [Rhodococcus sp. Z13]|uniref:ABC transporter substrate-binding protein n=1 Tax=Rhodococcus sacchari TaxID=2962047 RepID=A0ACD4DKY6_9NOCA|nr:ABC transporter substrate-binding protein [Rhodococcus sp. Z13]UYP20699.1 ABC transporter substrate-binding protein [Rhodococcus sp. Z13]
MAVTERNDPTSPRRSRRRVVACAAVAAALAAATAACGSEEEPLHSIGYAIDNVVTTYNANTVDGAASGAPQVFARVLPGFGYVAPSGQVVSDTDVGTAAVVPGDTLTVKYTLSPNAVYSDGVPMSCDDLVLTWAASSGRFTEPDESGTETNLFDAARRGGYADIDRVDCQAGSKEATVVFRPGRDDTDWKTLFGATELMPAHIAAARAGVGDLVGAVTGNDTDAVRRIAEFWNTGWALTPGEFDAALFPSAGPYRIESYTAEDGLTLVANERWWGNAPATDRIVIWPRGTEAATASGDGRIHVVDVAEGSLGYTPDLGDGAENTTVVSRNLEQLVLSTRGVFENPAARRAFALCVPRDRLFDEFGAAGEDGGVTGPVSSRLLPPDSPLYPQTAETAERYAHADVDAARSEREASGQDRMEVRIGYLGPDDRRSRIVALIAESCRESGIEVVDAGSDTFTPSRLADGEVDALLAGTATAAGAGGTADMEDARGALHSGTGSNVGGYADGRVDELLDGLLVAKDNASVAGQAVEAERILWDQVPTIPLLAQPRTIGFAPGLHAGVVNPTTAGAGWNMDRWILRG